MKTRLSLCGTTFFLVATLACAETVPHPGRPDRLVETRDGFSVEYSPGQEAWMERAFAEMRQEVSAPAENLPMPSSATPGSARYLRENRDAILAMIAEQTGLPKPTALQGRVFDTFLGHYMIMSELLESTSRRLPATVPVRHVAIWQRDELVNRLRNGAKIDGMAYDPATDSGYFSFNFNVNAITVLGNRLRQLQDEIEAHQLNHALEFGQGRYSATVNLGAKPDSRTPTPADALPESRDLASLFTAVVFPVIYRGDTATASMDESFGFLPRTLAMAHTAVRQQMMDYRDPNLVTIILHETAETGLVENLLSSPDRRWLCDGTANYVAWRVARDLAGPEFALQAYNLDASLRRHAESQSRIKLAAWPAVERQKPEERDTDLNRAHYAFATRAIFLIAERHGESAVAQLWADVAKTPKKKATAKTFADAYRKRFKGDLAKLVHEAEQAPIPVGPPPAPES